ncbi:hypothetical protein SAMN04488120_10660 [Fontimonas thermophila]|uniref:Uncharacterized protein n=1 Tax=Fontimonas thermophila TaxID=1076937 RepID=A0A1I2J8X6_9GAMM|nr:hypothetical protein [Fontimonas thermophila]SFF50974.1 hypothetical protein SAMN04488120_10660 [Fontimonas thermophila]
MPMPLKAGARLKSAVSETQVMVVKAPPGEHDLRCGGVEMIAATAPPPAGVALDPAYAGETLIGKRYVNADESLELLCTKGGQGVLSFNGTLLEIKQAKQLPSSD